MCFSKTEENAKNTKIFENNSAERFAFKIFDCVLEMFGL